MIQGGFGSSDTFSGGDVASGASGSHEHARAQDLGLPSTILARPSIHSIVPCCISQWLTAVEVDNVDKDQGVYRGDDHGGPESFVIPHIQNQ